MIKIKQKNKGFTLVEIMVSIAIFSIIVTAGMGALVSVLGAYQHSQKEKKSSDSVSYVLENMTREIRLGHNYYVSPGLEDGESGDTKNGEAYIDEGSLIGFDASDNRGYIIYYLEDGVFLKRHFSESGVINGALTDKEQVEIREARVRVMNAEDDFDQKQALVWIQLKAKVPDSDTEKVIQTLVSQRKLDTHDE